MEHLCVNTNDFLLVVTSLWLVDNELTNNSMRHHHWLPTQHLSHKAVTVTLVCVVWHHGYHLNARSQHLSHKAVTVTLVCVPSQRLLTSPEPQGCDCDTGLCSLIPWLPSQRPLTYSHVWEIGRQLVVTICGQLQYILVTVSQDSTFLVGHGLSRQATVSALWHMTSLEVVNGRL